jgi:DnaK suppressor protein
MPNDSEDFMNPLQQEYFRQKLLQWKTQLMKESFSTLQHLQQDSHAESDVVDSASNETDRALELRARDRARKLIQKIDAALHRIDEGTYGYCEETGEPIGVRRLDARPIATLCIEEQERHEKRERVHRED